MDEETNLLETEEPQETQGLKQILQNIIKLLKITKDFIINITKKLFTRAAFKKPTEFVPRENTEEKAERIETDITRSEYENYQKIISELEELEETKRIEGIAQPYGLDEIDEEQPIQMNIVSRNSEELEKQKLEDFEEDYQNELKEDLREELINL